MQPWPNPAPLLRHIGKLLDRTTRDRDGDKQQASACVEGFSSTRWASATFEGHRHEFTVRFDGRPDRVDGNAERFRAHLDGGDIHLRGELLADVCFVGEERISDGVLASRRLRFEALTVRD
jgi:hypothetical protein